VRETYHITVDWSYENAKGMRVRTCHINMNETSNEIEDYTWFKERSIKALKKSR
jgi:hypothetical protein